MWFELYVDSCRITKEPWRWRLRNGQDQVIAASTAGYSSEAACQSAVSDLKSISPKTPTKTRVDSRPKKVIKLPSRKQR